MPDHFSLLQLYAYVSPEVQRICTYLSVNFDEFIEATIIMLGHHIA